MINKMLLYKSAPKTADTSLKFTRDVKAKPLKQIVEELQKQGVDIQLCRKVTPTIF